MNHSTDLDQLAAALVLLQSCISTVPKTKTGKIAGEGRRGSYEYSYSYADLDECVKAAKVHLSACGLAVTQFPSSLDGRPALTTWLLHQSGQWINDTAELMLAKDDPQGQGSGITYMRRYAYCAALGLVADEDTDAAGIAGPSGAAHPRGRATGSTRQRESGEMASDAQKAALPKAAGSQGIDLQDLLSDCGYSMESLTKKQASHLFDVINKKTPWPRETAAPDSGTYPDEEPF